MLVALGFLAANLLALLIAPAFWARAVRLTTRRIKETMPLTEAEIRADKDRLRAEFAIKLHQLESETEQMRLAAARQSIDLNRRDAAINELEAEIERFRAEAEEAKNARRVLEQTLSDRLPKVEHRLSDARNHILNRDRAISELTQTADRQSRALSEAAAINAQQQGEIERLNSSLSTRGRRGRGATMEAAGDAEVALRSELEMLRAKSREQAQLIDRLQARSAQPGSAVVAINGSGRGEERLRSASSEPGAALAGSGQAANASSQEQSAEIARLKAALAVFEGEASNAADGESKISLKAKLKSAETQNEQQREMIEKLRSELAAMNEKLSQEASHFAGEVKRLGAGALPASGQPRRQITEPRLTLAERVAQTRLVPPAASGEPSQESAQLEAGGAGPNGATVPGNIEEGAAHDNGATPKSESDRAQKGSESEKSTPPERRVSLVERISGIAKTS
jgi:hypothetical protein